MNVYFRCDSSAGLGNGHMLRCLSLALLFRKMGIKCIFLSKDLPGSSLQIIKKWRFKTILLPRLPTSEIEDALLVKNIIPIRGSIIIVDNYDLGWRWESTFYNNHTICALDDLGRKHLAHYLIDTNYYRKQNPYQGLVPENCNIFLGPKFSLLRKEFLSIKKSNIFSTNNKIMVFFGGGDSAGNTLQFLRRLIRIQTPYRWQIVVSINNHFLKEISDIALPTNIMVLVNPKMGHVISQSNYYFGSGGTITWERMYLGLVGSVVSVAKNQVVPAKELAAGGYQPYLGNFSIKKFNYYIKSITKDLEGRQKLFARQKKGFLLTKPFPQPLVKKIISESKLRFPKISLKKATLKDCKFLFELRNDPIVRNASIHQEQINFKSHLTWLKKQLKVPKNTLYIIWLKKRRVGQIRIDAHQTISISLHKSIRGKKYGAYIIQLAMHKYRKKYRKRKFYAFIKVENKGSSQAFVSAGFRRIDRIIINSVLCEKYLNVYDQKG